MGLPSTTSLWTLRVGPTWELFPSDRILVLPVRPIPVVLDRCQLVFSASDVESTRTGILSATVRSQASSTRFRIAKNDAFDWFNVTPEGWGSQTGPDNDIFRGTPP